MALSQQNRVLVGVDAASESADALALGMALAAPLDALPLATHVHPHGDFDEALGDAAHGDSLQAAVDSMHDDMRRVGVPADERVITLVADRSAARGLRRAAEQSGATVIALGASRRSALGRVFPGGTAERLLENAPCPVAVAPSGYADGAAPLRTVAAAFDGSSASRAAFEWAKTFVRRLEDGVLRVVTVHKPLASAAPAYYGLAMVAERKLVRDALGRRLTATAAVAEAEGVATETALLEGHPPTVLAEHSAEVDLLVTGSRGRGPTLAALLGGVSIAAIRNAECPVVVVPRGAEGSLVMDRRSRCWR